MEACNWAANYIFQKEHSGFIKFEQIIIFLHSSDRSRNVESTIASKACLNMKRRVQGLLRNTTL